MKYYECKKCGCVFELVRCGDFDKCYCGESLKPLNENSVEASHEKHIPIAEVDGDTVRVRVAEVAHPMSADHYIGWVAITTDGGTQRRPLYPDSEPVATFVLQSGERLRDVYAYCNKHGLWSKKYNQ